jgi:alkylhydroperoxidase family enzyme
LGSEELVLGVLNDLEHSVLDEKEKSLFRFIAKVNHRASEITAADMEPLHAVGWTDDAIYSAISVCALFNFYNRWIDASGVQAMSEEAHSQYGSRTAQNGYLRKK